jgi:2-polyprenyl-6-methoxyphenol hydroxylase-like FAD-dependent oxidoreductase
MASDILIVGAGPAGLALAVSLGQFGIKPRIIDQASGLAGGSRAVALHSRTLEVLEMLGVADEVVTSGHRIHGASVYANGRRVLNFSFDELDSRFPYAVDLPQEETEQILTGALAEHGLEVEHNAALIGLDQNEGGVQASIQRPGKPVERWHGMFLAGCDGAFSTVRHLSSIRAGAVSPIESYVAAEVRLSHAPSDDEWHLSFTDDGVLAAAPVAGGAWRIIGDQRVLTDSRADTLRRVVSGHFGEISSLNWIGTYGVQKRQAAQFRSGRVFLAGDAAHVLSPVGGQGLNAGIQDAHNLAWKLAVAVRGRASELVLESYAVERQYAGRAVLALTEQLSAIANLRNPVSQQIRNRLLPVLAQFDIVQQRIARRIANAGLNYRDSPLVSQAGRWYSLGPAPGDQALDAPIAGGARLFDRIACARHVVLMFTGEQPSSENLRGFENTARYMHEGYAEGVQTILVSRAAMDWPGEKIVDVDGAIHHRYGAGLPCVYILRPDRYVGFRALSAEPMPVLEYFGRLSEEPGIDTASA